MTTNTIAMPIPAPYNGDHEYGSNADDSGSVTADQLRKLVDGTYDLEEGE